MKKIKVAAGIAALTTLVSAQALALECEVSTNLTDTQQTITLDITGDHSFENIAVRILKPGSNINPDTTLEEIRAMLVAGTTLTTDENMKISRSFILPADLEAGDYSIDLKTGSNAELHQQYFLYGFDELNTYFKTICENKEPQTVLDAFLSHGQTIGFDLKALKQLTGPEQKAAVELFIQNRASAAQLSVETVQAVLDEAVLVERIRVSGGEQQVFDEYEPILKLKESELYLEYAEDMKIAKLDGWYKRIAEQAQTASNINEQEGLGTPILKDTAAVRVIPEVISVGPADTSGKIQIDEIRIGSNLDAVLGQTSIYPEQFTVTEQGLYSNGAAIGESVAAGTPVEARLTMANTPDKDREVTLYAAAKLNGTLLDICMEIYKIKAGATEQIEFPIDFSGLTAQRYEVSLFSWEGMRPLCKQYEYMVE